MPATQAQLLRQIAEQQLELRMARMTDDELAHMLTYPRWRPAAQAEIDYRWHMAKVRDEFGPEPF